MKALSLPASNRAQLIASLLVFISAICFAAKAVLVKLAYQFDIDTISMLALRMIFSLPFFIVIAIYSNRKAKQREQTPITGRDLLKIAGLGLLGYYFASMFDFMGLQYISAGLERLILFIYPTLVVIISFFLFKKRITKAQGWALGLTYFGITIAFLENLLHGTNANFLLGVFYVFLSAFVFAFYLIGGSNVIPRFGTWRFTSLAMISASIAILIHHGITLQWRLWHYPMELYGLIFLMAIIATVLPSFLVAEGLRVIGSSNTSIISSFSPVATIIMANFILGEQFGWLQWFGTFLVIGGVLLTSLQKK
ncbi:MAG: DMT family transporter [Saprospiraceae bacterium]|nr:DMT family transporter [Saprospiraceae bacterium]